MQLGKRWDNNIYFSVGFKKGMLLSNKIKSGSMSIPHGTIKNREQMINAVVKNQKALLAQQVLILNFWTFKTPIFEWQITSYFLFHEYVILELLLDYQDKVYCSIEKDQTKIKIFYHDQFQIVRDYAPSVYKSLTLTEKRFTKEIWKPTKLKSSEVTCDYFELIRFLYINEEDKKGYNLISLNCQDFCEKVVGFLFDYSQCQ